jgi:hypothetical protein
MADGHVSVLLRLEIAHADSRILGRRVGSLMSTDLLGVLVRSLNAGSLRTHFVIIEAEDPTVVLHSCTQAGPGVTKSQPVCRNRS